MALNKEVLKLDLLNMIQELRKQTEADDTAYADALAAIIHNYIITATVTVNTVTTCGVGAGTGTGTGTLS